MEELERGRREQPPPPLARCHVFNSKAIIHSSLWGPSGLQADSIEQMVWMCVCVHVCVHMSHVYIGACVSVCVGLCV